jgi:hypothetical protein
MPIPGENKSKEIYKKSLCQAGRENVRLVGSLVTAASDLPALAAAIRAVRSVVLDLELYGPRKGDGLDP